MAAAGRLPPVDLPLREDLRTRLGWGHVFALQPLSEAETRAALRREADRRGIFLSDDVMDHLLTRFARHGLPDGPAGPAGSLLAGPQRARITVPLCATMLAEDAAGVPDEAGAVRPGRHAAAHRFRPCLRRVHDRPGLGRRRRGRRRNDAFYASTWPSGWTSRLRRLLHRALARPQPAAELAAASSASSTRWHGRLCATARWRWCSATAMQGDRLAVVTATNDFITRPIAELFGIQTLIATELERDAEGRVTGAIRGTPAFRDGKVGRVDDWLAAEGCTWSDFEAQVFYSDSINDLPLLERVSHPVATNPGPALEALAQQRRWPILRLFP
jgi:HAD superfamily phosphoserine phosphatase-like hydrolase